MPKTKKQKKKNINTISIVIFSIYLIISVVLVGIVTNLKVLPIKYFIPLLIIYLIITGVFGFISINKKFKKWLKIFIDVLSVLFIGIYGFCLYYLQSTLNFMGNIKADDYQTEEYYVIVKEESEYENIKDLDNEKMATYKSELDNYEEALDQLNKEVQTIEKEYESYIEASEALMDDEVEAVFLSSAYKSIVEDQIQNFENDTKILYTISIKVENTAAEVTQKDVTNEPFNIYISGIDVFGDISLVARSDVNMIVTVNPKTHKVLLTSIPRDYYVRLHGTTGYKDKLTHAGIYGINMSITTLEDLFDIDIDYYVRANFSTVIKLVDAIGGIDIVSDATFTAAADSKCRFKYGTNTVDGACALAYSRERYAYLEGDRHRVQNQQDVLKAILNKTLSSTTLITRYTKILESLGNSFQTNMPTEDIYKLVNKQIESMPNWNIEQYSVNGFDSHNFTYSYPSGKLYVMEPDIQTVSEAQNKIKILMEKAE